jgi:histone RNA hairpin-binding protein
MSSELISPSKLLYSRDFLLRYSSIKTEEPDITDKIPLTINSTPQSKPVLKNSSGTAIFRMAKTPNPRKTNSSTQLVYSQKENVPTQTPVKLGAESYATPLRKALVPRTFKSPIRKTWVTAVEGNIPFPSSSFNVSDYAKETVSMQLMTCQSLPMPMSMPEPKAFASPTLQISYSSGVDLPMTPARTVSSSSEPAVYLSPKSLSSPFRSPTTPGNLRYSPSKSPARPISPLDEQRLGQRQKQIDYGYRTVGYLRYRLLVAKDQRKPEHPRTPKKTQGCSKRSWDGQLKKWRRDLHLWDPDNTDAFKALLNSDLVVSIIAANPELAEIVDIVREKIDNPTSDYDEFDDSSSDFNPPTILSSERFIIEKKLTPPRDGDDSKVQNKVARTLVF